MRIRSLLSLLLLIPTVACLERIDAHQPGGPAGKDPARFVDLNLSRAKLDSFREFGDTARGHYGDENWDGCIEYFDRQLAFHPTNDSSLYDKSCCQALAGQTDEALASLTASIENGFRNRGHIERDTDLDSIRETDGFAAVLELIDSINAAAAAVDQLQGDSDPVGTFATLAELEQHYDDAGTELRKVRNVLSADETAQTRATIRRSWLADLEVHASRRPAEAAASGLSALVIQNKMTTVPTTLAADAEAFVELWGDQDEAAAAALIAAESTFGPTTDMDSWAEKMHAMAAASAHIVERWPDATSTRDAYFWLARSTMEAGDVETAVGHYRTLKDRWADDKQFWMQFDYDLFPHRLYADGLIDFAVDSTDGDELSLAAFRGQVTLLDFWATWCAPCKEELPSLKKTYRKYRGRGFEIVGFSADFEKRVNRESFVAWLEDEGLTWPQHYDGQGYQNEVLALYGIQGIPTTILIDRDGSIAAVNLRGEALEKKVAELISG